MKTKGFTYTRPMPPESMRIPKIGFVRAEDLEVFVRKEFLSRGGIFWDPTFGHLNTARIGILWAGLAHREGGAQRVGSAKVLKPSDPPKWGEAMGRALLHLMYGPTLPSFLITLWAPACFAYDDREFFALVDHELSHCDVAKDEYGAPRFSDETGEPVWTIRPHDVEQFVGTVERWGAPAAGTAEMFAAGAKRPRFDWVPGNDLDFSKVCGL